MQEAAVLARKQAAKVLSTPNPGWHERCSCAKRLPDNRSKKEISAMLWTILVILLVLWLVGLLSHVGGSLIHLLLVVAVVVLIINLVTGRRAV